MKFQKSLILVLLFTIFVSACSSAATPEENYYQPTVIEVEGETVVEKEVVAEAPAEAPEYNHPAATQTASGAIAEQPLPSPLPTMVPPGEVEPPQPPDAMYFDDYGVNPFVDAYEDHLSTFALDVDTASYSVARRYINDGQTYAYDR